MLEKTQHSVPWCSIQVDIPCTFSSFICGESYFVVKLHLFSLMMLLHYFLSMMKNIVRDAAVESLFFQGAWNFLPFVLLILHTRNYSDTLVHDSAYANGSCLLTCHFKPPVSSIENSFP